MYVYNKSLDEFINRYTSVGGPSTGFSTTLTTESFILYERINPLTP